MEDEDDLIAPPSPWPMTGGHGMLVILHLLDGALMIGVTLFAPPWAGEQPLAHYGFPEVSSADLQWGLTGMILFATVVAIGFSTAATVASFRLVSRFKLQGARLITGLAGGLIVAHGIGCAAGLAACVLASTMIYNG